MKKKVNSRCGVLSTTFAAMLFLAAADAETISLSGEGSIIMCPYLPIELIEVPLCNGAKATCVGTDDHDIIWGTDGPDVIYAGDGNDIVQADEGADIVCGGPGNDSIHGARGDDVLFGNEGSDWLFGAKGEDTLWGGPGDFDVLWGGPGEDRLDGGSGIKDACLHQKDIGRADIETCEAIHPPENYTHGEEGDLGVGVVGQR